MGKYEKYDWLARPRLGLNDIDVRDLMEFIQRNATESPCRLPVERYSASSRPVSEQQGGGLAPRCPSLHSRRYILLPHASPSERGGANLHYFAGHFLKPVRVQTFF